MTNNETKTKKLTNFKIIDREDIKGQTYYIIFDNDNEGGKNAYFCWKGTVKSGMKELIQNRDSMKNIEIEYMESEKGNRVIHLFSDTNEDNFNF